MSTGFVVNTPRCGHPSTSRLEENIQNVQEMSEEIPRRLQTLVDNASGDVEF